MSDDQAAQAHADLLDLAIERWPYELLAARAWGLRHNLSSYDASYVALAELIDAALVEFPQPSEAFVVPIAAIAAGVFRKRASPM